ncbi:unnamed protein product [Adineta ricciae]|uniref:UBC core domain-containing protein n=1 Tax=Adineta ricciae TaxID=249248 RepID=A0A815XQN3_ADIRI|nr:unnamed protein product [Adineta ricciae]
MASASKMNKHLWNNIVRLKLLAQPNHPNRFVFDFNPFGYVDDDDNDTIPTEPNEIVITGRIFPNSEVYKKTALRIEMKLIGEYPEEPPVVRILTRVYHPNVEEDGTFCHDLLNNAAKWHKKGLTTLAEVVRVVVEHIDNPNPDYAVNYDIGDEYINRRAEFERKVAENIKANLVPRD